MSDHLKKVLADQAAAAAGAQAAREITERTFAEHPPGPPARTAVCPQCGAAVIQPRDDTDYCEECGWPEENWAAVSRPPWRQKLRYLAAFLTVRPRRWFFRNCIFKGSFGAQWLPRRREEWDLYDGGGMLRTRWGMVVWPNVHWVLAYRTIFAFFKWLHWEGWRPFCDWTGGWRRTFPWIARVIQRIGQTTAGAAIHGGECWHCGSEEGCPVDLSGDETGRTFILERQWMAGTLDGTDHRFCGTTICPKCGYRSYYEDGSL